MRKRAVCVLLGNPPSGSGGGERPGRGEMWGHTAPGQPQPRRYRSARVPPALLIPDGAVLPGSPLPHPGSSLPSPPVPVYLSVFHPRGRLRTCRGVRVSPPGRRRRRKGRGRACGAGEGPEGRKTPTGRAAGRSPSPGFPPRGALHRAGGGSRRGGRVFPLSPSKPGPGSGRTEHPGAVGDPRPRCRRGSATPEPSGIRSPGAVGDPWPAQR